VDWIGGFARYCARGCAVRCSERCWCSWEIGWNRGEAHASL